MTEITSAVICQETSEEFAVRFEQQGGTWAAMKAWKPQEDEIDESTNSERTTVTGGISTHHSYDGCPDCSKNGFFKCGTCSSLSCYDGYSDTAYCHVCDEKRRISGNIDEIEGSEQSDSITDTSQSTDIARK